MDIRMLLAVLAGAAAVDAAAQETYTIDPIHSQPFFEARHIGYTVQFGGFSKTSGKITLDRAAKTGSIDFTVDAASVRTFDARLDAIVKGERFFNVEKYPTITFTSTAVKFDGDRLVGVEGDLTMLGVTKPVSFKVLNFTCGEHPFSKKPMCGCEATATIRRSDWGMSTNVATGSPADEVVLRIPVEAYRS